MKILQLIYESFGCPFGFGGAGVRAYEIYKRLKDRHDVTLLCMKYPGAKDGDIEGLKHIFAGTESKNIARSVLAYTINAGNFIRKYGKQFDVIVENFLPATPFFSKFMTKTPVILQIQGLWGSHYIRKFSLFYGLPMYIMEKIYLRLYDNFILVTDKGMGQLIKRSRICKIIPNGINQEFIGVNSEEGDFILFFSRIDTYQKGLDILIDAFGILAKTYDDIHLFLAGYEFNKTTDLFERLPSNLRNRVHYKGFVSGDERLNLLSKAKIFILPSRHEAHPISVMEAAGCGRPVIVSDISELQFVEENKFGLSFASGSAEDLCGKIITLLGDEKLRHNMGLYGREYAKNFLWDKVALQFEKALGE